MRVLVTGGCGFIGSNLVEALEKKEGITKIYCVDDMSAPREDASSWLVLRKNTEFINGCFASPEVLSIIHSGSVDTVYHVAAIPRVSYSVENPSLTTSTNINKTVALMEACVGNIKRFVFSSSSSVYGGADLMPTPSNFIKDPKSPYAWQKDSIEDLLKIFCGLYDNFDAVSLRYFNVFGPGQFGGSAYSTAISAWCHAIKHGKPLRKDGTGEQSRDLCYIDNVVSANLLASDYDLDLSGRCFNVACGDRISNNQILDFFLEKFSDIKIEHAPFRSGDVMHTQADISESIEVLGYKPLVRFWDGLEKTYEWWGI
jgi:nucleoside-diphosphate-sugar epimerase